MIRAWGTTAGPPVTQHTPDSPTVRPPGWQQLPPEGAQIVGKWGLATARGWGVRSAQGLSSPQRWLWSPGEATSPRPLPPPTPIRPGRASPSLSKGAAAPCSPRASSRCFPAPPAALPASCLPGAPKHKCLSGSRRAVSHLAPFVPCHGEHEH